jgi:mgtE-like transporter
MKPLDHQHIRKHLAVIRKLKRHEHHTLLHHIHKEHSISRKTLFYVKEYGHTKVFRTIMRESLNVLFLCAILGAVGGLALENIKSVFVLIVPLIILLPTLNDMIGDYGTIISARFSTMLHEGHVKGKWWHNHEINMLFKQIFIIAMLITLLSTAIALVFSRISNYQLTAAVALKVLAISLIDVAVLVLILFFASILLGLHFFKKQEDPNNFLIPIVTSIADFGNMIILSILVIIFF